MITKYIVKRKRISQGEHASLCISRTVWTYKHYPRGRIVTIFLPGTVTHNRLFSDSETIRTNPEHRKANNIPTLNNVRTWHLTKPHDADRPRYPMLITDVTKPFFGNITNTTNRSRHTFENSIYSLDQRAPKRAHPSPTECSTFHNAFLFRHKGPRTFRGSPHRRGGNLPLVT